MKGVEFYVDAITNSIVDVVTGESLETDVERIAPRDLKKILKKNGWRFNWKMESKYFPLSIFHYSMQPPQNVPCCAYCSSKH